MKKYIAKPNTWFKAGTECELETDCGEAGGIFRGIHVITDRIDAVNRGGKIGDEVEDGELCSWAEFEVIES